MTFEIIDCILLCHCVNLSLVVSLRCIGSRTIREGVEYPHHDTGMHEEIDQWRIIYRPPWQRGSTSQFWCNKCGSWETRVCPVSAFNVKYSLVKYNDVEGSKSSLRTKDRIKYLCESCVSASWVVGELCTLPLPSQMEYWEGGGSLNWPDDYNYQQWWCGTCASVLKSKEFKFIQAKYCRRLSGIFDYIPVQVNSTTRVCNTCFDNLEEVRVSEEAMES